MLEGLQLFGIGWESSDHAQQRLSSRHPGCVWCKLRYCFRCSYFLLGNSRCSPVVLALCVLLLKFHAVLHAHLNPQSQMNLYQTGHLSIFCFLSTTCIPRQYWDNGLLLKKRDSGTSLVSVRRTQVLKICILVHRQSLLLTMQSRHIWSHACLQLMHSAHNVKFNIAGEHNCGNTSSLPSRKPLHVGFALSELYHRLAGIMPCSNVRHIFIKPASWSTSSIQSNFSGIMDAKLLGS